LTALGRPPLPISLFALGVLDVSPDGLFGTRRDIAYRYGSFADRPEYLISKYFTYFDTGFFLHQRK
jgi:hypothetical protein